MSKKEKRDTEKEAMKEVIREIKNISENGTDHLEEWDNLKKILKEENKDE